MMALAVRSFRAALAGEHRAGADVTSRERTSVAARRDHFLCPDTADHGMVATDVVP